MKKAHLLILVSALSVAASTFTYAACINVQPTVQVSVHEQSGTPAQQNAQTTNQQGDNCFGNVNAGTNVQSHVGVNGATQNASSSNFQDTPAGQNPVEGLVNTPNVSIAPTIQKQVILPDGSLSGNIQANQ